MDTIDYKIVNRVTFDLPKVDGVEIETHAEREAAERAMRRMMESIEQQIADTIMYGDGPRTTLLR